jgi:SNF2 family DNA or RNA helicase
MLFLHAVVARRRIGFWAERTRHESDVAAPRKRVRAAPHPYAAAAGDLMSAVREVIPGIPAKHWTTETLLALPTVGGLPVPSSPIVGDIPSETPEIRIWEVAAWTPVEDSGIDLLACVGDGPTLAPGIGIGSSLRYWAAAMRFAAALVTRQQFLPDLVRHDGNWFARWTPVLAGNHATHFERLANAMPPAARATENASSASDVLRGFLGSVVDRLVRGPNPPRPRETFVTPHDRWLHALRTATGEFGGTDAEAVPLEAQIRQWRLPVAATESAPYRLCFRLDEPGENARNPDWQVQYLLQSRDDPSLQIPAAEVWSEDFRVGPGPGHSQPKPILLAGLGQAARVSPEIELSLKAAAPAGNSLSTDAAHRFLSETAWLLEQAGFGILLPSWWTGQATRRKLDVSAKVKSPSHSGGAESGLSLDALLEFQWTVAIGDEELTLKELRELAGKKASLVRFRGQWMEFNAEEIRKAIELLKKKPERITARDAMKIALGTPPEGVPLDVKGAIATGWMGTFLKQLTSAEFAELPPPAGLQATMRPYQIRGYSWLAFLRRWGLGACLADDMGLGKTLQTLALLLRDREAGTKSPVLLVCPMSVVGNWSREAARFVPDLRLLVHHGPLRAKTPAALKKALGKATGKASGKVDLVLTSYGLLTRDRELFEAVAWSGVVLDEAQTIKNANSKTAEAARAMPSEFRIALTGTPVENHVGDLWALGQFLNPGLLGNAAEFRREFFTPIQRHQDPSAANRLKKRTGPFLLRRLKTDPTVIRDLPSKIETTEFCTLTREQASLYAAVVEDLSEAIRGVHGIQRKGLVLGALSKLKQVCNHPAQFLGDRSAIPNRSGKLNRLTQLMEEVLDAGEKSLIFTQFTAMGDILLRHLQETFGREVLFLHGGTSRKLRDSMVQRFQSADGPPIFLLSLKAGGTGLNLTAATHVFHYDRWWNPAVETQATDRAFRIGQTRTVQVHPFVCSGTLEEKIDAMLTRKRQVAAAVVGTGEAWLTQLDDAQLREMFTLSPDAVED